MAEQAGGDDVRINVDGVATKLSTMMRDNLSMSPSRCIFRVPNILLRHNPEAYAPNAFSIGPFHYNKPNLQATQKIKLKYLHDLISRSPYTTPETKLMNLTKAIREVQEEACECYAGLINMSTDEFVQILVLDGCFLIELFRKFIYDAHEEDDPIFSVSCMLQFLYHDLILLENQIPWLVLDLLFNMTKTSEDKWPLNIITIVFFGDSISRKVSLLEHGDLLASFFSEQHDHKHILYLLRNSMAFYSSINDENSSTDSTMDWQQMPSATILQEAGIKFKKAKSTASLLDIEFKNGVLEIPPLLIHETTESLFRNLICLEQCLPNCHGVITSYAILLDNLINTSKDMEILCKSEVIDNWLNIEEATEFFNQLYNDTLVKDFYYTKLINEVNEYCRRRWPKYRRVLMHDYFKHPWALISVIVAAILLILTFLQTYFTIINK